MTVSVEIPFEPVAAVRPKVTRWSVYYPGAYGEYLPTVRDWLSSEWTKTPFDCPVAVSLTFVLSRPKSHFRSGRNSHLVKTSAPLYPRQDIDNFAKGALDVLSGHLFIDDKQVVRLVADKRYKANESPGYTRASVTPYVG